MRQTRVLLWFFLCGALTLPAAASAEQLYVADGSSNLISGFSIGAEGALSPIACEPEACETGKEPTTLAISPNGKFVFVVNRGGQTVFSFAIGSDGVLSEVGCGKHCTLPNKPTGIATAPNGQYVYVGSVGSSTSESGSVASFSVGPTGALTKIKCDPNSNCQTATGKPVGLAVSPDGRFLYTTTEPKDEAEPGVVSVFSIGSKSELTPVPCSSCETGVKPTGITIAPNGLYLYVANGGSNTVSPFQINADGTLTPIACVESACETGTEPTEPTEPPVPAEPAGATVSPNGKYLFVADAGSKSLSEFTIGADGALSPLACAGLTCETESAPVGIAVSPDGDFLYAANSGSSTISPFAVGLEGALSPLACTSPNCSTASAPDFESLAITPDQAPTASFTDKVEPVDSASTFNASASSASPERSVALYQWNFGDGGTAESTSPEVSHTYFTKGEYTVTLTVTDSAGCSTQSIFTGQTASCNGSSSAQQVVSVNVPSVSSESSTKSKLPSLVLFGKRSTTTTALRLVLSSLRETEKRWREGKALARISSRKPSVPVGTRFSFDLNQSARVTFAFIQSLPGRSVSKRCVAPTKKNEHAHHCLRSVIAGTLKLSAARGLSTVRFDGLFSKYKRLSPGDYTLVVSATAPSGQHATTTALHFTIARPAG
jgi:DNA-binding beta-propeller fold protein YncE